MQLQAFAYSMSLFLHLFASNAFLLFVSSLAFAIIETVHTQHLSFQPRAASTTFLIDGMFSKSPYFQ